MSITSPSEVGCLVVERVGEFTTQPGLVNRLLIPGQFVPGVPADAELADSQIAELALRLVAC
jgi:hypothetical protein